MNLHDIADALLGPAVIAAAVILVVLFGREPKGADEHTVDDYRHVEPSVEDWDAPVSAPVSRDILPPAPAGMNAGSPLYAGMLFDTWHPESPAAVAARFLREVGEDARAKAGIRPAYATDRRDMTGSFPVVRAA